MFVKVFRGLSDMASQFEEFKKQNYMHCSNPLSNIVFNISVT